MTGGIMPDTKPTTRSPGDVTFHAAICVGIGDEADADVLAETEHETLADAQTWVQAELPRAKFPAWVARRPHGTAGAFLYGSIDEGWYVQYDDGLSWEPDPKRHRSIDGDLVHGTVTWHESR
jgi:hypothetical protein